MAPQTVNRPRKRVRWRAWLENTQVITVSGAAAVANVLVGSGALSVAMARRRPWLGPLEAALLTGIQSVAVLTVAALLLAALGHFGGKSLWVLTLPWLLAGVVVW